MRRGWQRVAECGDNRAFAPEEVTAAIIPALEEDCRAELPSEFLENLCRVYRDQEVSLFKDELAARLEALRAIAGYGIGRVILDHAIQLSERGETGLDGGAVKAVIAALTDRAARGARQVEEHYCRRSTEPRALRVRARIEDAIDNARSGIEGFARRTLKLDFGPSAAVRKNRGLDDGVTF
jgi:hypothetical protein